ncbi:MAG: hypothetical protein WCD47_07975 [Candidatus Sulfotelmatobacter sp.]
MKSPNLIYIAATCLFSALVFPNDRGEIVGFAVDSTNGATVAFLAVPVLNGRGSSSKTLQMQKGGNSRNFVVPENVRQQLLRRLGVVVPGKN